MVHTYKGYTVEKVAPRQWNISKGETVIDATDTLKQAKYLISGWAPSVSKEAK